MQHKTRDEHLFGTGSKRILALDGGGIRGILTLGYLKRLEDILRARYGNDPDFSLSDYFDLIGGTSTGSIIATGLALGFSVEKLQSIYRTLAGEVFKKPLLSLGLFSAKFPEEPLIEALTENFSDHTLGSEELKTGLMIMTKRFDTGSPWVIHNNPRGKYFNPPEGDHKALPNRDFLLRQVVRASTAAPHYFQPESFPVGEGEDAAFIDGGVSAFNNPSLQMFMMATLKGFGYNWPVGVTKLLLVSVGTGYQKTRYTAKEVMDMPAVQLAGMSLLGLMSECDWLGQTMLQWLSDSPTATPINREIGDLADDLLGGRKLLSYLRYNVRFDSVWLKDNLDVVMDAKEVGSLTAMDQPKNIDLLANLGTTAAAIQMEESHLPKAFDIV
ncbi:MAG: patatin-like phospholipase family protein [Chloroflexi bacterium]|nr:patatin-like phospholipase family protein [Chloroflexota bacterium]